MVVTCTSAEAESTLLVPSTSKMGSLLYCGMTVGHRLMSRSFTLPPPQAVPHNFDARSSQLSLPIMEPRSFAMILKKYHLKAKYLVSTRARHKMYQ